LRSPRLPFADRGRGVIGGDRVRRLSLFWQVFLVDAAVLVVITVLLALAPVTISVPIKLDQLAVLLAGLVVLLLVTLSILRRTLRPLEQLTETMRRIDPLSPGQRVSVDESDADVIALTAAFNEMLDRLETERRDSARMALSVQEAERRRIARELHDEVGQTLTAMLLQIESMSTEVSGGLRDELEELRETARTGAEDVRHIAQRLRPEALDELGLQSALLALTTGFSEQAGVEVRRRIARDLPLTEEEELVIYRVAQEALTNVARHADARSVEFTVGEDDGAVVLKVCDDGRGAEPGQLMSSYGVRGMRERALLVGASLSVESRPGRGTNVTLRIPERG
jgi:two-component system, NarL family, sensor histidine kinase UhpB